jgi:hypothetical protein
VKRGSVVERSQLRQIVERCGDVVVDDDRLAKPTATVDDPVGDGADLIGCGIEARERPCLVVLTDHRELQAGRPRVDDEDDQ